MILHGSKRQEFVIAAAAAVICLLVFLPALTCGFVNLDDPDYVLNNPLIRHLDATAFVDVFSKPHAGFWIPLTWLSLAIDYHFWGLNPLGYHLTNVILHAINTGLVVLITAKVMHGDGQSGQGAVKNIYPVMLLLTGLLWGIHPLRVESVVWVTERKDVLNGLFTFSSVLSYQYYVESRESSFRSRSLYVLSFVLFVCSLMAKSVTILLPLVLLVIDWHPYKREVKTGFLSLVVEKLPYLACSVVITVITLLCAKDYGMLASPESLTFSHRLLVSGNAIFEYCRLMLYPTGIMPLHIIDQSEMVMYGLKTAVVGVVCVVMYAMWRRRPVIATGFCFILPLLPALAFFQNGLQAFAARFTYIPAVAPTILVCGLLARSSLWNVRGWRQVVAAMMVLLVIAGIALATFRQVGVWQNTVTLWSRVIKVKPSGLAYKERGLYRFANGNYPAAIEDLTVSLEFARRADLPESFNLYAFRGEALRLQQRYAEAADEFGRAISLCARREYFFRRGLALEGSGRIEQASADFRYAGSADGPLKWIEKDACE